MNDLVALALAVPELEAIDVEMLNDAPAVEHGPIGVVTPGTGPGEAFLAAGGIYLGAARLCKNSR